MFTQLEKIFKPKSIAAVGVTEREGTVGYVLMKNLLEGGFQGKIYPVNPKRDNILGVKCYPSVKDLPETVDLAVIAAPAKAVPGVVEQCGETGVGGLVIISAGFKEAGEEGQKMLDQILESCRKYKMRLIGPNCLGIINPSLGINATFANRMALPGNIAFISQSGALCASILDWSLEQSVGFSHFVSIGSMVDVGFAELIDYFGTDPATSCMLIYMESLTHARKFMSAARAFARNKPIIILKAGKSSEGGKATMSHTGSLAGNDAAFDAAFQRAGCIRVERISQLFDCAQALAMQPRPSGNRLAILTNAGGPGVLATDYLTTRGGKLAALSEETMARLNEILPEHWSHNNPVDVLGDASAEIYKQALQVCLADTNVDGVLAILTTQGVTSPASVAQAVIETAGNNRKPILASWMGEADVREAREILEKGRVPNYRYPESAVDVFLQMCQYTRNLDLLYETPNQAPQNFTPQRDVAWHILRNALVANRKYLLEHEAKALLGCYGVPVAKPLVATTAQEAGKFAAQSGFPVVLKIISPDALHKTEVGGVRLNISTKEEAEKAFDEIIASLKKHKPDAHVHGILVEKMVKKRYELLLGAKQDPVFGPLIAFGQGGVAVEIIKDTNLGLPPLNMALAHHLIEGTKIYQLLKGFRGIPAVDLDDLAFTLRKFAQILVDFPEIQEIDINPLLYDENGGIAVDARILLDHYHPRRKGHPFDHLVISPYPEKYSKKVLLKNGGTALLRPIRPEDEPAEVEMLKSVSDQSLYFRFFGYVPRFTHEMLTRFTHIDYDREMALVAEVEEDGEKKLAGVVRIISDAWGEAAEFAILIADPWQNQGLGMQMTDYILEIARDKGIRHIYASVLSSNQRMLKMFQDRGFQIKSEGQDGYAIELDLQTAMPFVTELPFQPA